MRRSCDPASSRLERAERTDDPATRAACLTFVVVGGGPTGVEMAGAVAELTRHALRREFRSIDPAQARIILVEAGERILSTFPERLSGDALRRLEALGVVVMTGKAVQAISARGVEVAGALIASETVIWGAGTRAAPAGQWLGLTGSGGGRIPVRRDLALDSYADIYALGDVAACPDGDGKTLPALAQVANQQGDHLGRALARAREGERLPDFVFRNRGNTAIIGRNAAVFDFGKGRMLTGRPAWLLWALVHIYLLNGLERRFLVATQWLVRYVTRQRGARLIAGAATMETQDRRPAPET
jgi:NADH:ubiquinone reductase (H+-translocating)